MERISLLLDKIKELNNVPTKTVIEIDLMLDYTRVIYADLLEWRSKLSFSEAVSSGKSEETEPFTPPVDAVVPPEETTDIAAPAIELENTSSHYESAASAEHFDLSLLSKPSRNADMREMIGVNDKYAFISELFGNNKAAYEDVVSEINTFETEEEAITWLAHSVFQQFGWKEESEAVQSFYKLLREFFMPNQ
jgi:hypothetical protein